MTQQLCRLGLLSLTALLLFVVAGPPLCGQDKPGVWTLDIKFENPKVVTVKIPGRGERTIWCLEYEVTNKTDRERQFAPAFSLASNRRKNEIADEILAAAKDKLGDGRHNSVTVSKDAIPAGGKIKAVAYFDGEEVTATRFTVYARGLSNGFTTQDKKTAYKTLQVEFQRGGEGQAIRQVGAPKWIYRAPAKEPQ